MLQYHLRFKEPLSLQSPRIFLKCNAQAPAYSLLLPGPSQCRPANQLAAWPRKCPTPRTSRRTGCSAPRQVGSPVSISRPTILCVSRKHVHCLFLFLSPLLVSLSFLVCLYVLFMSTSSTSPLNLSRPVSRFLAFPYPSCQVGDLVAQQRGSEERGAHLQPKLRRGRRPEAPE